MVVGCLLLLCNTVVTDMLTSVDPLLLWCTIAMGLLISACLLLLTILIFFKNRAFLALFIQIYTLNSNYNLKIDYMA
jgi:hypothetical protein